MASPAQPPDPSRRPSRSPSVAIIGTDVMLAAFPATPVQVAHACQRMGFDLAVPASWGDELVAAATLERLAQADAPATAVFCACPKVRDRLLAPGHELAPTLLTVVPPPVAAARYVRALWKDTPVRVTYMGACPGAEHDDIDERLLPREFLRALVDRDIVLADLPRVFDSVIPPDRRRYHSLPGGLPSPERMAELGSPRALRCLTSGDYAAELAEQLLGGEPALVDLGPRLGCACSGAMASTPWDQARATVTALEPPHAPGPVVERAAVGALDAPLPPPAAVPDEPRSRAPLGPVLAAPRSVHHTPPAVPRHGSATSEPNTGSFRRRGVTGFFRGYTPDVPRTRAGEQALPRAYVGLRRPGDARTSGAHPTVPAIVERELPLSRSIEPAPPADAAPANGRSAHAAHAAHALANTITWSPRPSLPLDRRLVRVVPPPRDRRRPTGVVDFLDGARDAFACGTVVAALLGLVGLAVVAVAR